MLINKLLLTVSLVLLAMVNVLLMTEVRQSRLVRRMLDRVARLMKNVAQEETAGERHFRLSWAVNMLIVILTTGYLTGMAIRLELSLWLVLMVGFFLGNIVLSIARDPMLRPKWLDLADRLPKRTYLLGLLALLLGIVTGALAIWM